METVGHAGRLLLPRRRRRRSLKTNDTFGAMQALSLDVLKTSATVDCMLCTCLHPAKPPSLLFTCSTCSLCAGHMLHAGPSTSVHL